MRLPSRPGTDRSSGPISLARRGVTGRLARRAVAAALLAGALATLTGCRGALVNGYYLLPAAREAYIAEDFESSDEGRWSFDAEEGYQRRLEVVGGYLVAGEARQFARSEDRIPTTFEARAEWEVWSPDATTIRDNDDDFDFRIMLDTSDSGGDVPSNVRVELKLFDEGSEDRLTITDDASGQSVSATSSTIALTRGTIHATFRRGVDASSVSAVVRDRAGESFLEAELVLEDRWERDAYFTIAASAHVDGDLIEARAVDSVHALRLEEL